MNVRFLADMCVAQGVVTWLRRQGHDATHLRDEGLHRLPNGEIFSKAVAENRIVITFDLDFGEIAALTAGRKTSIIVFRLHNARTHNVLARLSRVLPELKSVLATGAVVVIEESRYRIRHLPVGERGDEREGGLV